MLDMSAVAVSDRLSLSLSRHIWSSHNQDAASFRRLSSDASLNRNGRCHLLHRNMSTNAFHRGKQFLQVKATVGYPASISWWKKGDQQRNMQEITSGDQFYDALAAAAREDKLVLVDFYSTGCRSCKVLYPKIYQLAAQNPNLEILTVNFYDNLALCRSLNVNVLPFFHFYRGSAGRLDAFSCSLSKIEKLRTAVAKYQQDHPFSTNSLGCSYVEPPSNFDLALPQTLATAGVA